MEKAHAITEQDGPAASETEAAGTVPHTQFYRQVQVVALCLLIVVLSIHLLREFATVLQQLLIAAFLAYLILPVHYWLMRRGLPPGLAFAFIVILILGGAFGLGHMMYRSGEDFNRNWPRYQNNLKTLMLSVSEEAPAMVTERVQQFFEGQEISLESHFRMIQSAAGSFFDFLSQVVLVLIYLIFVLAERMSLARRMRKGFDPVRAGRIEALVTRINESIGKYLAVKTAMSVLGGVLTTVVLLSFGVDYAAFWGIVAFLLNYIPYLGAWVAVILPVLLSLVQFASPLRAGVILAVLLAIQNGIGYAVEPRIAGNRLNLSPLVIILSLAFWGTLWGIVGMILAVPLVVVVKSILENIPETKPLAVLLSNE